MSIARVAKIGNRWFTPLSQTCIFEEPRMPRKSAAALQSPASHASRTRPLAPAGMSPDAAKLWRVICASLPPGYFTRSDLVLLEALVTATIQKAGCDELVRLEGLILEGKAHPGLKLSIQLAASMAALSGKLRLCVSSRIRPESAELRRAVAGGPRPWESPDPVQEFFQ